MKMHSQFIKLYDDCGYEYIVNIDKITCVSVEGKKVWIEGNAMVAALMPSFLGGED